MEKGHEDFLAKMKAEAAKLANSPEHKAAQERERELHNSLEKQHNDLVNKGEIKSVDLKRLREQLRAADSEQEK